MPRSITAFVSQHQRNRCHVSTFPRGEVFDLGANFTACLDGSTITSVVWRSSNGACVGLGAGTIVAGLAVILATAGVGTCSVKAIATMSDGRKVAQLYRIEVQSSPWFTGETTPSTGTALVTVTA